MSSTAELYGIRKSGISHGDVYTSPCVVKFMLDLIGYTPDKDLSALKVLEPSFGSGEFLIEIIDRLLQSARAFNFSATEAIETNIHGCELDNAKYTDCLRRLSERYGCINFTGLINKDFLLADFEKEFDFIVGNPPYVRYENLPRDERELYKNKFSTFHYRSDLYVMFFEHSLHMLKAEGKHCFICADRWLKNEYGRKLRELISKEFTLDFFLNLEKVNPFEEEVLAYPAITVISKGIKKKLKTATIDSLNQFETAINWEEVAMPRGAQWDVLFDQCGCHSLYTIEEQGFSIGIGVATGADSIFISNELKGRIEDELLMPIINARDLSNDNFNWSGRYLLNPYSLSGELVSLEDYPKAYSYLSGFREKLERRHIVRNKRQWYSLIDRIKPGLCNSHKILLPDISGNKYVFVEKGNYYPSHNLYYITGGNTADLEILAAVLMSDFVRRQIKSISNCMNGGFPRWQSQYLRKLRIPEIKQISLSDRAYLIRAYRDRDHSEINSVTDEIVRGCRRREKTTNPIAVQLSLF